MRSILLVENPIIHTASHRIQATTSFEVSFNLRREQQRIKLSLEPNEDIIPHGAEIQYLDQDGNVARAERIDRNAHKIFKGHTWVEKRPGEWINVGWARVSIRRDGEYPLFEGAFIIAQDSHHVQLRSNYLQTRHEDDPLLDISDEEQMIIFRDSDISIKEQHEHSGLRRRDESSGICSWDQLAFNVDSAHPVFAGVTKRDVTNWQSTSMASLFGKRQIDSTGSGNSGGVNLMASIGSTSGCPSIRKVALIGVATDCTYTASFNSSEATSANVLAVVNQASQVYEQTFNISLGLQNLTVSPAECPGTPPTSAPWNVDCSGNDTITSRLNTFSEWRGQRNDTNAYWTLMTQCNTGAEVGLAWLGQLCVNSVVSGGSGESVSGANVVARTSTEWQVFAHESGHTFGAVHDCTSQTCSDGTTVNAQQCCPLSSSSCPANGQFIMNPSTSPGVTGFSLCTVGNICSALLRNSVSSSCLSDNKQIATISGNQCGNGIVEAGEECDCGGVSGCKDNACCDATTCKFKNGAICDDSNEDCCSQCTFSAAGTVCRASTGICNPAEMCSGQNATCPPDVTAPNGQDCGGGLSCSSGQCTSRDLQCQTLMGSYASNNDTYACNSQDCTLSCASPSFGPNTCYSMQQNFLDGTTCGGGGSCSNVSCS